ncbi:Pyridoxamine 5'-phosphate oxidase [Caballeronia hypogeia]|uniref:Pyridoxamine 5'-phosphate oxidase n=1 Tax=Caballeronia hypogeia TaxID=1777140 RepID=A0A158AFD3_9BURK|nr:GAF domain-containing protein [Caballeronia hypogeia]SAK56415.1 Pyridoxamine 5'-phosphate oxidase [Caballeronia hypogeia]
MIRLSDLDDCFEGVIPSIIATVAGDGTPNISYLSHVVRVDDAHVAISNQFFAKTAANIRANPHASLLLVSARHGAQYRLDVTWLSSRDEGPLFDRVSDQLRASSAQVGMAGIMRLRAIDIFRVDAIAAVQPAVAQAEAEHASPTSDLAILADAIKAIGAQTDTEHVLRATLDACNALGFGHALVLLADNARRLLTTVASRGYARSGIGSEIAFDDGLGGVAAASRRAVKINDMSRVRRMSAAIGSTSDADENLTRTIALPGLPDAMSQLATPLLAQGVVRGVLFAESRDRLAFTGNHEIALDMLAAQCAASLALCEALAPDSRPEYVAAAPASRSARTIQVTHHPYDDSVFIDNVYVIKGVAGRLLAFMLRTLIDEGRCDFTNREIRLADTLKLPDIKDNLETRLLLLRRRLDEKNLPVRLIHAGRGQVRLAVDGVPVLSRGG